MCCFVLCTAALVKLLRRCVNQMTGKTRLYVDTSIKFEREASQQVGFFPFHSHFLSTLMGMKNELALHSTAGFNAACWHTCLLGWLLRAPLSNQAETQSLA